MPKSSSEPTKGQYYVFHHTYGADGKFVKMYVTHPDIIPEFKGAFLHIVTEDREEVWISGPITMRKKQIKF